MVGWITKMEKIDEWWMDRKKQMDGRIDRKQYMKKWMVGWIKNI